MTVSATSNEADKGEGHGQAEGQEKELADEAAHETDGDVVMVEPAMAPATSLVPVMTESWTQITCW